VDGATITESGSRVAAVAVPPAPAAPLRLKSEPRIETYEATKPNGEIVFVTHNLDTGRSSYEPTVRRAFPLPEGDDAA
jgi:hypothetical protein